MAMQAAAPVRPSFAGTLRALEGLLLRGGQSTARRNAWTAVLEDRRRAKARVEAAHVLAEAAAGGDVRPVAGTPHPAT